MTRENWPQRRSIRLQGYDYSQAGAYYVTLCTYLREWLFGDIVENGLQISPLGNIALTHWIHLPEHYPIDLDAFVIMPNHMHGIVIIGGLDLAGDQADLPAKRTEVGITPSLGEIIRGYKSFSARAINNERGMSGSPVWQRGYYEHIIRNEASLQRIRQYIADNPIRWEIDPYRTG